MNRFGFMNGLKAGTAHRFYALTETAGNARL